MLVQAYPDDLNQLHVQRRRDAFCGKISVCNNLRQYGIPFSLTERAHRRTSPTDEFQRELLKFLGVCRVVRGLRRARIGAIGARPNAFNTTRYSEKLLEATGISVSTLDLSEVLDGAAQARRRRPAGDAEAGRDQRLRRRARACRNASLVLMAKFGVIVLEWMTQLDLDAYGHSVLELAAEELRRQLLHHHEHDEREAHAQRVRGRRRRHGRDVRAAARVGQAERARRLEQQLRRRPEQVRVLPLRQLGQGVPAGHQDRHRADSGHDRSASRTPTARSLAARRSGPVTFGRISTDDRNGAHPAYVGEGQFTDDP